jgi:hypothetical protein
MYPFFEDVAPMIRAMSLATLGFSAMQTIIFLGRLLQVSCFFNIPG